MNFHLKAIWTFCSNQAIIRLLLVSCLEILNFEMRGIAEKIKKGILETGNLKTSPRMETVGDCELVTNKRHSYAQHLRVCCPTTPLLGLERRERLLLLLYKKNDHRFQLPKIGRWYIDESSTWSTDSLEADWVSGSTSLAPFIRGRLHELSFERFLNLLLKPGNYKTCVG